MRVVQFVILFLALSVVCGCSHRRAQRVPVATTLCDCSSCRYDQERLVREGAVPADHFQNDEAVQPGKPADMISPTKAQPVVGDFAPEYSTAPGSVSTTRSPYSSGNPIEMDGEVPQMISSPSVNDIEVGADQFLESTSTSDLNIDLELPSSNQITPDSEDIGPIDQIPTETVPDGAFKPFDRDVFKVKSKIENLMPPEQQPSILIDKAVETRQPDLSSFDLSTKRLQQLPKLAEPETNDAEPETNNLQFSDSLSLDQLSLEQEQPEAIEATESVEEIHQPNLTQLKPVEKIVLPAEKLVLPAPTETAFVAQTIAPTSQPNRPTESVVEGELYADPVVLYARQRRGLMTSSAVQNPGVVHPASMQKPVAHQSIVQDSELDPVYGLPLSNNVEFDSLPAIQQPPVAPADQSQHLHVHIHHDYSQAPAGQVRHSEQTGQQARNVQVVYRDDEGRVIMAPPTPTGSISSAEPIGDQRTYYVPPEQILRLKATSPINRPRSNPSVATIQMRDTITHGGTHLLATPEYQARPVLTEYGLPGVEYNKLREAFKDSPADNPLR